MSALNYRNSYTVPKWCRMHPVDHFDGLGGCWGVSHGLVEKRGRDYCRSCGFYSRNFGKCDPLMPMTAPLKAELDATWSRP